MQTRPANLYTAPLWVIAVFLSALAVSGCEQEQPQVRLLIRAIKPYTVIGVASGQTRKFASQVYATNSSTLSFQVVGNVQEMRVNQGEGVTKGQILAVLDKQPYQLDVQSAEAELQKARAERAQAGQEFIRQESLFKKGWVAEARLDRALRSRDSAISQTEYATSKLNLARRNLRLTELTAPFAGSISRKHVEAFVEVRTGQPVYDIEAAGALEVRFDVPETMISRITLGMPVTVTFPTARQSVLQVRITEIGSSAERANAFPVKAGLVEAPADVRSGMTAETTILFAEPGQRSSYLVPISAIAPADTPGQGYVFVYEAQSQTVKRRLIKGKGASDNFAHIYEGVKAGDVVASAGVSFLMDGQRVKLMDQRAKTSRNVTGLAQ